MIFGIGIDVLKVDRVEKVYEKHGERFVRHLLLPAERTQLELTARPVRFLAMRFAAKEACAKALGTGLSFGVYWRDMGVVNLPSGKPTMRLTNGAARVLERLVPRGMKPHIHLTITDDGGMAQAFVIIEALPVDQQAAVP